MICGELVARCFQARTDAHIAHLATRSFAEHKALNEFYDGIVGLADTYAEACQGRYGLLKIPMSPKSKAENSVALITELRNWIDNNREECGSHSEIQNTIDEIVDLCNSTLYKLRFLS